MISVLIANRNGEDHLGRCLESLRSCGLRHEVVVVDNASEDGSLRLVEREFPEVRVLAQELNLGFAAATNLAAEAAVGEAYLLLNADAWLDACAMRSLADRLWREDGVGLVAPELRSPDGRLQFAWSPARSLLGEALQRIRNPFEARAWAHGPVARAVGRIAGPLWYTAACVLVRAEAFREVAGFDSGYFMYFEDVDLCCRLRASGWRLVQERTAVVRHAGGLGRSRPGNDVYRASQLRYYARHRPGWELRALRWYLGRRFGSEPVDRWWKEASRP